MSATAHAPDLRVAQPAAVAPPRRRFKVARRLLHDPVACLSGGFLLLLLIVAIIGPWISVYPPNRQDLSNVLADPSAAHLLGTDELGRDLLVRMIAGTRTTLIALAIATGSAFAIGLPLGLITGYIGGWFDRIVSLCADALMSIPGLLLAIAAIGILGPDLTTSMLAVGVIESPRLLRLVRASTMAAREEPYVEASVTAGASMSRLLIQHVLPNIWSTLIVYATVLAARAVLIEASLSFIGLGAQYPQSSWGLILNTLVNNLSRAPLLVYFPGLAITLLVLALSLFGDALRAAFGRSAA